MNKQEDVVHFYNTLAADYDAMTGFEKRFVTERPFFRMIAERYGITTAVDAGCGTGFHSLVLAQLGVRVTGVDVSQAMLDSLSLHAQQLNLTVNCVRADFETLPQSLNRTYDAVFCLGNSLAHLLSNDQLHAALGNFSSVLNPDGHLFLQILNYDRILENRERVQNVKEVGGTTFIRFYDYEGGFVHFNILKLEKKGETTKQSLNTITLNPIRKAGIEEMLVKAGYADVSFFGGISLEPFILETSKDLVVVARKP